MKRYDLYFDGASRGNPGKGACAFQAFVGTRLEKESSFFLGDNITNNIAEYNGLVAVAEWLNENANRNDADVFIYTDSELVAKQISGEYKIKDITLLNLADKAIRLLAGFAWQIKHISREENALADRLCNQELDKVRLANIESTRVDDFTVRQIKNKLATIYIVVEEIEELLR